MMNTRTLTSFDRNYAIGRLKRQARGMRLEAARAASVLADQLTSLAATVEAEARALEHGLDAQLPAWRMNP
jgi:uncharacterized membrane-anchored protein